MKTGALIIGRHLDYVWQLPSLLYHCGYAVDLVMESPGPLAEHSLIDRHHPALDGALVVGDDPVPRLRAHRKERRGPMMIGEDRGSAMRRVCPDTRRRTSQRTDSQSSADPSR